MHARTVCGICALAMRITALFLFGFQAACSNSPVATDGGDATAVEDTGPPRDPNKNCVKPGTPNNELGVGGYCDPKDDAGNFKNPPDCKPIPDGDGGMLYSFCTAGHADLDQWFCTRPCMLGDDSPCGSTGYCGCRGMECGCVPNICGSPPAKDAASDVKTDG